MQKQSRLTFWANLAFIFGGLLMAVFLVIYTNVHGPTSYDETNSFLGQSTLFWSLWLSVPPNGLIALGLLLLYAQFFGQANRSARVGYALTLFSLIVPAALDFFVWGRIGAPFFFPLLALGLMLMASGHEPPINRILLRLNGVLLAVAFGAVLIPQEFSDGIGGDRWFAGLFSPWLGVDGVRRHSFQRGSAKPSGRSLTPCSTLSRKNFTGRSSPSSPRASLGWLAL